MWSNDSADNNMRYRDMNWLGFEWSKHSTEAHTLNIDYLLYYVAEINVHGKI